MTSYRKNRLINIARTLQSKQNGRTFHVSFILKNNKILSIGVNNYKKRHLENRFGKYHPTKDDGSRYIPGIHSEVASIRTFINIFGHDDFSGLTLFNVRLSCAGEAMIAKPCHNCGNLLSSWSFKDILWTT